MPPVFISFPCPHFVCIMYYALLYVLYAGANLVVSLTVSQSDKVCVY